MYPEKFSEHQVLLSIIKYFFNPVNNRRVISAHDVSDGFVRHAAAA